MKMGPAGGMLGGLGEGVGYGRYEGEGGRWIGWVKERKKVVRGFVELSDCDYGVQADAEELC